MRRFALFVLGINLALTATVRPDEAMTAQKIIDNAIKALGDEAKLRESQAATWTSSGTYSGMGTSTPFTGEWAYQPPDKSRVMLELDLNGRKTAFVTIYNKGKGWLQYSGMTMEMDKEYLQEQRQGMHANGVVRLLVLREKGFKFSLIGDSKIENGDAVGVIVSRETFRDVTLYIDKDISLLLKSETVVKNEQGREVRQETYYKDYSQVQGVKYPGKITIKRDGQIYVEAKNAEFKPVEKLNDALFEKP